MNEKIENKIHMNHKKKLIIVGDGYFAQIVYEYFQNDSEYTVVGFSVEKDYRKINILFGLPVVDFETMESIFSIYEHDIFVAVSFIKLNRVRTRLYLESKKKGYKIASYVSSRAFCWKNVKLGENVFIFENNTIQPFVSIGNNVILWSGNHIGHHSEIKDNCFISSHVVISGHCTIGENCFMGVNSTVADNVTIAEDCLIGMGTVINKPTKANSLYKGNISVASEVSAKQIFKVEN